MGPAPSLQVRPPRGPSTATSRSWPAMRVSTTTPRRCGRLTRQRVHDQPGENALSVQHVAPVAITRVVSVAAVDGARARAERADRRPRHQPKPEVHIDELKAKISVRKPQASSANCRRNITAVGSSQFSFAVQPASARPARGCGRAACGSGYGPCRTVLAAVSSLSTRPGRNSDTGIVG